MANCMVTGALVDNNIMTNPNGFPTCLENLDVNEVMNKHTKLLANGASQTTIGSHN